MEEIIYSIWSKKMNEFFYSEPLFVMKKFKNKDWKWYKLWKKRYRYDLVKNPKYGRTY